MPKEPHLHRLGLALGVGFRLWVLDSRLGFATLFRAIGFMPNEPRLHRLGLALGLGLQLWLRLCVLDSRLGFDTLFRTAGLHA